MDETTKQTESEFDAQGIRKFVKPEAKFFDAAKEARNKEKELENKQFNDIRDRKAKLAEETKKAFLLQHEAEVEQARIQEIERKQAAYQRELETLKQMQEDREIKRTTVLN